MCDNAGNKNNKNFKTNFLAVVTPTIIGKSQNTFIFIIFIIKIIPINANNNFCFMFFSKRKFLTIIKQFSFVKYIWDLLIFLKNILGELSIRSSTSFFGKNSSLAIIPLPSIALGDTRNREPSNIISGICISTSCVTTKFKLLS